MHLAAITVAGYGQVVKSETERHIYDLAISSVENSVLH